MRAKIFALILLSGCAAGAWSQRAPATLEASVELPDAPQSQLPSAVSITPQVAPAQAASEQPAPGSIRGVIVDHDGAVYEGVHVTLKTSALETAATTTDSNGRFSFSGVAAGPFQLIVSSNGFATQTVSGLLHPGESDEMLPIVLPFAATTSQVEVTASRVEIATEELHAEEQQRIFGVIPNFYVVYAPNAPPLSSKQKFHLAWRSEIDPVDIAVDAVAAGIEQAANSYSGYGQGVQGYAKRFGAAYGTDFIGTMIGGAILPSLLKQDPRYFYKGTGSIRARAFYAIATSVICKSDKGSWQPNYSAILGGLAAGGIANLYYPDADRNGAALYFENVLLGTAGTAVQNLFQEFIVRKLTPKVPNYGPSYAPSSYGSSRP
jgi:hypothetical protein